MEATRSENLRNKQKLRKDNKTQVSGVYFDKRRQRWTAQGNKEGKQITIGRFHTFKGAVEARKQFDKKEGYNQPQGVFI